MALQVVLEQALFAVSVIAMWAWILTAVLRAFFPHVVWNARGNLTLQRAEVADQVRICLAQRFRCRISVARCISCHAATVHGVLWRSSGATRRVSMAASGLAATDAASPLTARNPLVEACLFASLSAVNARFQASWRENGAHQ